MKNQFLKIVCVLSCFGLVACIGNEDSPTGSSESPFDNPFQSLSDAPAVDGLVGDWTITSTTTTIPETDVCAIVQASQQSLLNLNISENKVCSIAEQAQDAAVAFTCQAAGEDVVIFESQPTETEDCDLTLETVISLALNEDGETLSGTFVGRTTVSGDCAEGVTLGTCEYTGTASGELVDPAGDPDPTDPVDTDQDGFDTSTDCNDTDATIFPGATEIAGNSIDEDCDGADAAANPEDPTCTDGDTTCDPDIDNDGLCDVAALCNNNDIDPDSSYANDWYWVDSEAGDPLLDNTSPVLIAPRLFFDGTYNDDTIVVFGVIEGFKEQNLVYTFCNGTYGTLLGVCVER